MAEYTNNTAQAVALGGNVLFTETAVKSCPCVKHRDGSGIFTLKGGHTYLVNFGANITGATADTQVALSLAIAGEAIPTTLMVATPATANELINVGSAIEVQVPCGCCYSLSVQNTGTTANTVQNANLIIRRED